MQLIKLLIKDFRLIYRESLIIIILGVGAVLMNVSLRISGDSLNNIQNYILLLSFLKITSVFLSIFVPAVFLYSVIKEKMNKTDYQIFSLPVPRYKLLFSKFSLIFIAGLCFLAGPSIVVWLLSFLHRGDRLIIALFDGIALCVSIFGILSFVLGISSIIKKNRILLGISILAGIWYANTKIMPKILFAISSFYLNTIENSPNSGNTIFRHMFLGNYPFYPDIILIPAGLIFLLIGLFLYSKFEEV